MFAVIIAKCSGGSPFPDTLHDCKVTVQNPSGKFI